MVKIDLLIFFVIEFIEFYRNNNTNSDIEEIIQFIRSILFCFVFWIILFSQFKRIIENNKFFVQ